MDTPQPNAPDGPTVLVWSGEVTVSSAAEHHAKLVAAMNAGRGLVINAEGLCHLDTSALQLLAATRIASERQGTLFRLESVSPSVTETIRLAGLLELLC